MKKLLVLMLVLALVSAANAAVVVTYTNTTQGVDALTNDAAVGDVIQISVGLDALGAGGNTGFAITVDQATGGAVSHSAAGWMMPPADKAPTVVGNGLKLWWGNGVFLMPAPVQNYLFASFTVPTGATDPIGVTYAGTFGGVTPAAAELGVVPEPMTVALLGLGGLFLRRRK